MDYIHRHIEKKIKEAQSMFKAVLVTGARQVGKSTEIGLPVIRITT